MSNPTLTNDVTHDSWWRAAVIYQVYIRSFADGDGDGTGDIAGLRSRLHYLAHLGVDAIWINPWYPSPLADGGYDVSDFRDIHPTYGTLEDARKLITEAHELGLRVILDIVPNHVSDQHARFQEALAAAPGSTERKRFVFRDGRGEDGSLPPNDWYAAFGGPTWTRTPDGQWYLHLFAPEQPDLNWDNGEVRAEFESILRFWFDLGVDGFRIDVAHGMFKDPALPDLGLTEFSVIAHEDDHPHWDRDGVHDIFRSWRAIADSYPDPRVFVAEAHVRPGRMPGYLRPDEPHRLQLRLPQVRLRGGQAEGGDRPHNHRSGEGRRRHLGPVQPRRSPPRHPLRPCPHRRHDPDARSEPPHRPRPRHPPSTGGGPADAGTARRRVHLPGRGNSACTRSKTSRSRSSRTPLGNAPATRSEAATAAASPCPGPATLRPSASAHSCPQ